MYNSGKCPRGHVEVPSGGLLQEKWRGEFEGGGGVSNVEEGPLTF